MMMEMRGDWRCVSIVPGGLCAVMNLTPTMLLLPVRHWEGLEEMVSDVFIKPYVCRTTILGCMTHI